MQFAHLTICQKVSHFSSKGCVLVSFTFTSFYKGMTTNLHAYFPPQVNLFLLVLPCNEGPSCALFLVDHQHLIHLHASVAPFHHFHLLPTCNSATCADCLCISRPTVLSPISEMNERMGQWQSNSASLTNGLSWQLHLLTIEERQGCSHALAADLCSRSLFR